MMLRTVPGEHQFIRIGTGVSALLHGTVIVARFQSCELKNSRLIRDGPGTGGADLLKPHDGIADSRAGDFVHDDAFDRDGILRRRDWHA